MKPKKPGDMRIEYTPLAEVQKWPQNPKLHADEALDASMDRFGYVEPIMLDERSGRLVAGHGRLERLVAQHAAGKAPPERIKVRGKAWLVPVVRGVSFRDDSEAEAYLLASNQLTIAGGWKDADLYPMLERVRATQGQLRGIGFTAESIAELRVRLAPPPDVTEDEPVDPTDEILAKWAALGCVAGSLWEIPSADELRVHHVLCGDCRRPEDVARLLDGRKVNVAFTSPPYASQRKYDEESGFRPIAPEKYVEWFEPVQANVRAHLAADGSWFVNIKEHCEDGERSLYVKDLTIAHKRRWGWMFVDEFCWRDTRNGVPGGWTNRFKDAWEPVFHYAAGNGIRFHPDAVAQESDHCFGYNPKDTKSASGSGFIATRVNGYKSGRARPSNVIELLPADGKDGHSAAFPVGLPAFFMRAYSDSGDAIYDPFMGSGTTILAADKLDRVGYGTEISARYVAVTLERLTRAGLHPRLVEG